MSVETETDVLIARWVQQNPHHPEPESAWILPRNVSAWVVVHQYELESGDASSVGEAFCLPVEAVNAAIAYYGRHKAEIDARIERNRAFFHS